jgi:hypothetical protein
MNETLRCRYAIILRGPPAIGKSCVAGLLAANVPCGQSKRIDLDYGWGKAQNKRYLAGEGRYADLKTREDFVILELGCGEPDDWSFNGATRNPREWVSILEDEEREIHAFLLWTDLNNWKRRLLKKVPEGDPGAEQYYLLFERNEWKNFPQVACIQEQHLDTSAITSEGVANYIWERVKGKRK